MTITAATTDAASARSAPPPMLGAQGRTVGLLSERGLLSGKDLGRGQAIAAELRQPLPKVLLRIGAFSEQDYLAALAEALDLPVAQRSDLPAAAEPVAEAMERLGLPLAWFAARQAAAWLNGHGLTVAAADPTDPGLREAVEAAAPGGPVRWMIASGQLVELAHAKVAPQPDAGLGSDDADPDQLREMAEEAPVIDMVAKMFADAVEQGASDLHVESYEEGFVVRFRKDGLLHTYAEHGRARLDAVVSRIKLTAGMDIAERRLPQDGRETVRVGGRDVDLRVSSVPSVWGESIVVRLLRKQSALPDLEGLGLTGAADARLRELLAKPNGVLLVTGPTGSGKSTTLYRSLELLQDGHTKVITIEDPVEYDVPGITQIQVRSEIGYDFARGLRAVLRQDPDVIMVGEIRDGETATIAAQAALTGHYVLSTLHTNTALEAPTRLADIGLPRYLIAAAVRGLVAQRLVRRLCEGCAAPLVAPDPALAARLTEGGPPLPDGDWRGAVGCEACDGTGYAGRVALFEVAVVDDDLAEAITEGASAAKLGEIARRAGFEPLVRDGIAKAAAGLTTLEEVARVCGAGRG